MLMAFLAELLPHTQAEPWRSKCFTGGTRDGQTEQQRQPVQWRREQPDVSAGSPRLGWGREKASRGQVPSLCAPQLSENLALLQPKPRVWPGPGLSGCYSRGANPKLTTVCSLRVPLQRLL